MEESPYKWGMVIDLDRCTGCQACVVACQAENNIPPNWESTYHEQRAITWMRIERYWEGEYPNVKVRYIPVPCQHCGNAPCEPVCPVFATNHSPEGLNVQTYNRCIGTRYCANNCPYTVRYFNYWPPRWPESLHNQLNPDVTVRTKGLIEKCTFCIQRLRRAERQAAREGRLVRDGEAQPACVQTCPSGALVFGNVKDPQSQVARWRGNRRGYRLLEDLGTDSAIVYLKKVDPHARG